jgi:hypothetical protein
MSDKQLISHLGECRRRLSELRARPDYVPIFCAMFRTEGSGMAIHAEDLFGPVLGRHPRQERRHFSNDENPYAVAFFLDGNGESEPIEPAIRAVEAITNVALRLLSSLPNPVRERLVLPRGACWWRVGFHLAWHFRQPFLHAVRERLLTADGTKFLRAEDVFVQMHGAAGQKDLLSGLIYRRLEHDLCTCSEAAIDVVIDALQSCQPTAMVAPSLSPEQQGLFRRLLADFEFGARAALPHKVECKLLKLANWYETPPATDWAELEVGGCTERFLTLSKLNDQCEICQVRGPATDWLCDLAGQAGEALPVQNFPDVPILFDNKRPNQEGILIGMSGPRPVMNRNPVGRWVGFVFALLKQLGHEALTIRWMTGMGPLGHGLATLDRDLFAASALAIDLAGLAGERAEAAPAPQTDAVRMPSNPPGPDFNGWTFREAPTEQIEDLPTPASGRLVIATDPGGIDGLSELRGETRHLAPRDGHLALLWRNGRDEEVLHQTDGYLLEGCQSDATWLPAGWEMNTFPMGWTLPHLERWFDYALAIAAMEDRPDIPPGSERSPTYAPTPGGLVANAYLIVRRLRLPGSPLEPRGPMDRAGCIAELRDVRDFFRMAMGQEVSAAPLSTEERTGPTAAASRVATLLDVAARAYASSNGSVHLVAIPDGVSVNCCEKDDPHTGEVIGGQVLLPFACVTRLGGANVEGKGRYALLAYSPLRRGPEEMDRFVAFAREAGAALISSPPPWAPPLRPGDAAETWVAALMFFSPATTQYAVDRNGGCQLIVRPWAASVLTLREWQCAERLQPDPPERVRVSGEPLAAGTPPTGTQKHPDGPEGGSWLWSDNNRHAVPTGRTYQILEYMWDREFAGYDDLLHHLGTIAELTTIRGWAYDVNNVLHKAGVPWRLKANGRSRVMRKESAV